MKIYKQVTILSSNNLFIANIQYKLFKSPLVILLFYLLCIIINMICNPIWKL